jgi:hypothetical protein
LLEDRAWFVPYTDSDIPIYIGESASTAFASSVCQVLDKSFSRRSHVPRQHYVSDSQLIPGTNDFTPWPSLAKARLLVKVAIAHIGPIHHVILANATFERLNQIYQDLSCATPIDTGKFFGLFALGEACSNQARTATDLKSIPGLPFFLAASRLVQSPPERGTIELVENVLLLVSWLI